MTSNTQNVAVVAGVVAVLLAVASVVVAVVVAVAARTNVLASEADVR